MNFANIKICVINKKHYYQDYGSEHRCAQNLLNREFQPASNNTSGAGDITYIRTTQECCQYSALEFRNKLKMYHITQTMNRRGVIW